MPHYQIVKPSVPRLTFQKKLPPLQYINTTALKNNYCDKDLILRNAIKQNDEAAFETLYRKYWRELYVHARNTLKSQFHAEEAVEIVFINLWNKRASLEVDDVRDYLYRAVRNRCLNVIRRMLTEEKSWNYFKKFISDISPSAEETFLNGEISSAVEKKLSLLPAITQQIFRMKEMEGLSVKDIGAQLNCSRKMIDYHLSKSKQFLKISLEEFLFFVVLLSV